MYGLGARAFWIHNIGPIGCLPAATFDAENTKPGLRDSVGCIRTHNAMAVELNRQLKAKVHALRGELSHAALTYVDVYSAKFQLIRNANLYGIN